jgi:hypothetical protein
MGQKQGFHFITNQEKTLYETISNVSKNIENVYLQNKEKQVKFKELESQIDQLVYQLYNLTPDEIKIIEGER